MSGLIFYTTNALGLLFISLLLPAIIGLLGNEGERSLNLMLWIILGLFVCSACLMALKQRARSIDRAHGLLAVVVIWSILPFAASIPFLIMGDMSWGKAMFEAVSGLTTTGASTVKHSHDLPLSMLVWRSELEWLGGFLTLACIIHVMSPAGIGGLPRLQVPSLDSISDDGLATIQPFFRLFKRYCMVTLIFIVCLLLTGLNGMEALSLAMSAISTGGFLPFDGPLEQSISVATQIVFALLLALSATSLLWQQILWSDQKRTLTGNREARWIFFLIIALGLIYTARLYFLIGAPNAWSPLNALREGMFAAISLVSTTGVQTRPGVIGVLPHLLVLFVVLAGASIFSTTGGIKLYRVGGLILQAHKELALLIFPSSIPPQRISGITYENDSLRALWSVFISALILIVVGTFSLTLWQMEFQPAISAAIALFANAGPVYEALRPTVADQASWPLFYDFEGFGLLFSMIIMLLGRLEVIVVFAALSVTYWVNR